MFICVRLSVLRTAADFTQPECSVCFTLGWDLVCISERIKDGGVKGSRRTGATAPNKNAHILFDASHCSQHGVHDFSVTSQSSLDSLKKRV